jgi:hypothetical protein
VYPSGKRRACEVEGEGSASTSRDSERATIKDRASIFPFSFSPFALYRLHVSSHGVEGVREDAVVRETRLGVAKVDGPGTSNNRHDISILASSFSSAFSSAFFIWHFSYGIFHTANSLALRPKSYGAKRILLFNLHSPARHYFPYTISHPF